jgi:GNAT superfamily N-acetyltransferase
MVTQANISELIRTATKPEDFAAFAALVTDYVGWCRARYADEVSFIDDVFGHQALVRELAALHSAYSPPQGRTLLAVQDGQVRGGGAYRRLADGTCEMKRLFVPDRFKGRGIGRSLCAALVAAARADGYRVMKLDTGDRLAEAISLYTSLGFRRCAAYHEYPPQLMRHLVFMELSLEEAPGRGAA